MIIDTIQLLKRRRNIIKRLRLCLSNILWYPRSGYDVSTNEFARLKKKKITKSQVE